MTLIQRLPKRWYLGLIPLLLCLVLLRLGCRREVSPDRNFDVPALLGKDINEIGGELGNAVWNDAYAQRKYGKLIDKPYAYKTWEHGNRALTAIYINDWGQASDKSVQELMVTTVDEPGAHSDKSIFLNMGGLREGDPRYSLEFIDDPKQPGQYIGVKVRSLAPATSTS